MEQDGTDGISVWNSACFAEEKNLEFLSKPFLGREKPSEFCSEPFSDEKTSEFSSEPFS
jgi:hypothetical protein